MTPIAHRFAPFQRVLALALPGSDPEAAILAALRITEARNILLVGLVVLPPAESLAFGVLAARETRSRLLRLGAARGIRTRVRVTHAPWREIVHTAQQEQPDLMVVGYPFGPDPLPVEVQNGLAKPPCDLVLAHGSLASVSAPIRQIVAPLRGGPYAELAVRLALSVANLSGAEITALHVRPPADADAVARRRDAAFQELARVLADLPAVTLREVEGNDEIDAILVGSRSADLVVMGSTARFTGSSCGAVADRVIAESKASVMLARSRRAVPAEGADPAMAQGAIALLVDKWLAENTFHVDEFANLEEWLSLKEQRGVTVSLVVPSCNAEATIGKVIRAIKSSLYDRTPLLDEIVVIDAGSTDRTCAIAMDLGVPLYSQHEILPQYGALPGQGETLWKSLYLTRGDLIVCLDADHLDASPRHICGLLGPLLSDDRVQFVKGFGRRPSEAAGKGPGDAGDMAELAARPLLSLLYPELSGVLQVLNGPLASRRTLLENLPFHTGAGVQLGLLIEVLKRCGLSAIAQAELPGQPGDAGARSSNAHIEAAYSVTQLLIRELERRHGLALVDDVNRTMKLVRADAGRLYLELREVREPTRPPISEIPEYLAIRSGVDAS